MKRGGYYGKASFIHLCDAHFDEYNMGAGDESQGCR